MDPSTRKATLGRAAAWLASDPAAAGEAARAALDSAPNDPNATLILGSALRRQGKPGEAVAVLEPLVRSFPNAHPALFELGMALADAGKPGRALAALEAATRLDPDNAEAWWALGGLRFAAGDAAGAEAALGARQVAKVTDARLKRAAAAIYGGFPAEGEATLRGIAASEPDNLEAADLLAEACVRLGRHDEASSLLERVLERRPADNEVRFRLARALYQQQEGAEARARLEPLLAAEPTNPGYLSLAALVAAQLGDFDRAIEHYEALLPARAGHPPTWASYGHALRVAGRADDARAAYRQAINLDRGCAEAYLGLANLKNAAFSDEDVAALRGLSSQPQLPLDDRQAGAFALGQALEDRGEYDASFASYALAAALRRSTRPYDAEAFTAQVRRSIELFDAAFFAVRSGFGAKARDPIFIVGLPRSGSTLVEQILASHSAVEGTSELFDIRNLANQLATPYPDGVAELSAEQSRALGDSYLETTRVQRKLGRPHFTDKMGNNFQFLGLIRLILPNAKIIDARRHPMAACFSAYKQHFRRIQISNDLADIGHYYRDYVTLMAHFEQALPGVVHRVIYDDLVDDTEAEVRKLLDHCGLAFEPQCLSFHETQRVVRTVSSEQVRRPIYREGLDQWRNYEPWLGPLKDALGPALENWR